MRTVKGQIAELKKRLGKIEDKLFDISKITAISKDTSNFFWSRLLNQAKKEYEKARVIFAEWANNNMSFFYDKDLRKSILKIKQMAYKPPEMVSFIKFKDNNINVQTKASIVSDTISDFVIGLDSGEKKLNRLLRASQQVNITEESLNKSVIEGFNEKRSIYGVKKKVQQVLLQDALDKKYITVVNKNGDPINYKMTSYSELVARTKITDMQAASTVNLSLALGNDLVQVSSHNTITPICMFYEGKIFSLSGKDNRFPPMTNQPPYHCNCQHRLTVYFADAQPAETLQKASDFSLGKSDIHPTLKSHLPNNDIKARLLNAKKSIETSRMTKRTKNELKDINRKLTKV